VLAFRYQNPQSPFTYNTKGNEGVIDLGPYYLVWDNISHPELIKDGEYGWPYQIAEIEPIQYASYYSKVFPFKKTNNLVREGFEAFKKNCMACHALKDQGGQKGPQLWPYPPLARFGREKFMQWVLSPQKLAPQTTMPSLNPELPLKERKKLASKIYLYLSALHKSKK
jgi:cytochrome c2